MLEWTGIGKKSLQITFLAREYQRNFRPLYCRVRTVRLAQDQPFRLQPDR